jgi:hypothetical protein
MAHEVNTFRVPMLHNRKICNFYSSAHIVDMNGVLIGACHAKM